MSVAGLFRGELVNVGGWDSCFSVFLGAVLSPEFESRISLTDSRCDVEKLLPMQYVVRFFCMVIGLVGGILSSQVWWLVFI